MKNILLSIIICSLTLTGLSQIRVNLPEEVLNKRVKVCLDASKTQNNTSIQTPEAPMNIHGLASNEHEIGNTSYDMQSNRMLQNRIYFHADGSIGAVWIRGVEEPPDFPDRGTGYNYYDGNAWGAQPQSRIESFRAGWPSYASLGPEGEIVVCHNFLVGLYTLTRDDKGSGEWTESLYSYSTGPEILACARMITGGQDHNSIHLLANSWDEYMGQEKTIVYSRSQDRGETWNIENVILEGTGSDYYNAIWVDNYVWADEKNGTIAFLCANYFAHDMFMMKSSDDGDTWEKTIIWDHPYPFYNLNTLADTFFCVDGSANIALDSEGMAHVVFGISKIWKDSPGIYIYLDPYCDGIGYWNEEMDPFSNDRHALAPPEYGYSNSEMVKDYNYIGWMQDVNGNGTIDLNTDMFSYFETYGASTMPTIMVSEENEIYVLFASTTEGYETGDHNYKHIWARGFCYGEWREFTHLTGDAAHLFDECIHPVLVSLSDDNIHYIYHVDETPGLAAIHGVHSYQNNRIIYGIAPKMAICMDAIDEENYANNDQLILEIYPNPCADITRLRYLIHDPSTSIGRQRLADGTALGTGSRYLKCDLYSISGIKIKRLIDEIQMPGEHEIEIDMNDLPAGMYYIRVEAGEQVAIHKLVVVKQ